MSVHFCHCFVSQVYLIFMQQRTFCVCLRVLLKLPLINFSILLHSRIIKFPRIILHSLSFIPQISSFVSSMFGAWYGNICVAFID